VAIRFVGRARPALVIAALGSAALLAPTLASAAAPHPNKPKPTISSVQQELGHLALKNSQLVEKFDHARVVLHRRDNAASAAERAAARARAAYRTAHNDFTRVIQAQYESGTMGAAGALMDSDSGTNYLDRLDTMDLVSAHNADVVASVTAKQATAVSKSKHAAHLLAGAQARRDALAKDRRQVSGRIEKYKRLLARLNSAQQAAYAAQFNPQAHQKINTDDLPRASSKQAQQAVRFALAQVGKPYSWGAAGPGAYDCSGLTMESWASAGVHLPHSAAAQYGYGTHVSRSQLEPGDLIFFYQPIGHVTIYIGNGLMVSAPTYGEPVAVVPLAYFNSDYVGATRL
jgi:cell wall-associated NlpC family hydrolase